MKEKYGIVRCSNPQPPQVREELEKLCSILSANGAEAVVGKYLFTDEDDFTPGWIRAQELMKLYRTEGMTDIFDISGGDMGNDVLDFLDYEAIARSGATFWGYSDLTTVINAIYTQTGKPSHLFQIRNLVRDTTGAGDAFCAGVAVGLTYGKTMREAVEIGTRLAASVITGSENVCPRFLPRELGLDIEVND